MSPIEHQPVLLASVLEALDPQASGRYVDGTLGGGSHAAAILEKSTPTGWLFGCDRDAQAIEIAARRLARFAGRYELRHGNFADLGDWLAPASCDGVLLDLGFSSYQLDPARGFSFQADGPLDMRMDRRQGLTAAELVNEASVETLERIFWELGGERRARQIARAIERERRTARITTTGQLARLIERVAPRGGRAIHASTACFQSLRVAVNDEVGSLKRGLEAAWKVLKPGGRLAVIAFHSGEDRLVKSFGQDLARAYVVPGGVDVPELRRPRDAQLRWISRKAIRPSEQEIAANPRARSARLRVMEKAAQE